MVNAYLENTSIDQSHLRAPISSEHHLEGGVILNYDDATDELQILFGLGPERRHVDPINHYLSFYCDSGTDEPFGFILENFLTHAVHEFPRLEAIAKYLQLGSRPYKDPHLYRQEAPPRASQPDYAWSDAAHDAVQNIVEITGGVLEP